MRMTVKIFQCARCNLHANDIGTMNRPPFTISGSQSATTPVVISVPHAGRDYPDLAAQLQVPVASLRALEDREVDALASAAIRQGVTALIAHTPRLIIDLNRAEGELDPGLLGWLPSGPPLSARTRGGLGLIPRRLAGVGEIWRGPLAEADVAERLAQHYRPYHAALTLLLKSVRRRFGAVVLIDLHSMPTLAGSQAANIVIGDRFGHSAPAHLTACAEATFAGMGYRVAINTPYAGGHILDRHAQPADGVYALQVEVDRALYLDRSGHAGGPGFSRVSGAIALSCARLADEIAPKLSVAAE
jgi:N-formylglutamate amidohydrolase